MTGFVVKIRRREKWAYVDIDELTDAEFDRVQLPADDGWLWAIGLAKWIRDNINPRPIDPASLRLHSPVDLAAADGADRANGPG